MIRVQGFQGSSDPPQNRRIKMPKNCKELTVWQKSQEFWLKIHGIAAKFPNGERQGLTSKIRRSAFKFLGPLTPRILVSSSPTRPP
jgi:hypothetical protein